jgi:diphthamide biosynthesis protein 7
MGSYNEKGSRFFITFPILFYSQPNSVYLWDHRKMQSPIAEERVGGGVWRIKTHPLRPDLILLAAMHGGFHVLKLDVSTGFS